MTVRMRSMFIGVGFREVVTDLQSVIFMEELLEDPWTDRVSNREAFES